MQQWGKSAKLPSSLCEMGGLQNCHCPDRFGAGNRKSVKQSIAGPRSHQACCQRLPLCCRLCARRQTMCCAFTCTVPKKCSSASPHNPRTVRRRACKAAPLSQRSLWESAPACEPAANRREVRKALRWPLVKRHWCPKPGGFVLICLRYCRHTDHCWPTSLGCSSASIVGRSE